MKSTTTTVAVLGAVCAGALLTARFPLSAAESPRPATGIGNEIAGSTFAKLIGSNGTAGDELGTSAALSGDTAVVGAPLDDTGGTSAGIAYVFQQNHGGTNNWGEVEALQAGDVFAGDRFGTSVAIDGDFVVVGAEGESTNTGAAYIFHRDEDGTDAWGQVLKLTASDAATGDSFGSSVAIDGDSIVVGARAEDRTGCTNCGAAYVFEHDGPNRDDWTQVAKLTGSEAAGADGMGTSVAIDVDTIVVGAPQGSGTTEGKAYVFVEPVGGWSTDTEDARLTAGAVGDSGDKFGQSIAISGGTVVVGAYQDDYDSYTDIGSAYVFDEPGGGWSGTPAYTVKIESSDGGSEDQFGLSVSIDNDIILIGAPRNSHSGVDQPGAAYFMHRNECGADNWGEMAKIEASDADQDAFFGSAVSVAGTLCVVGAYKDDVISDIDEGSAYIFDDVCYCPAHLNDDDVVNVLDLIALLHEWGSCTGCPEDLNCDDTVNVLDLILVLTDWGLCQCGSGSVVPLEDEIEDADLTWSKDWDDFMDTVENESETEATKENWAWWMHHYLTCHENGLCAGVTGNPGRDPYAGH